MIETIEVLVNESDYALPKEKLPRMDKLTTLLEKNFNLQKILSIYSKWNWTESEEERVKEIENLISFLNSLDKGEFTEMVICGLNTEYIAELIGWVLKTASLFQIKALLKELAWRGEWKTLLNVLILNIDRLD